MRIFVGEGRPTILLDMPTNFVIGQILMLIAQREIRSRADDLVTFPMKCALFYSAFIFVPITAWYFYSHTGWSSVYLVPEDKIQFWMGPGFFIQYFFGMLIGAWLAQLLIQRGQTKMVYITLVLGLVWLFSTFGMTLDQYLHVGTYTQYFQGNALSLFSAENQSFQDKLNLMGALLFLPVLALGGYFLKRSFR